MWKSSQLKLIGVLILCGLLLVCLSPPALGAGGYTISNADMQQLQQLVSDLQTNLATAQSELTASKTSLKQASDKIKSLEESLSKAEQMQQTLQSQLDQQVQESQELVTQLAEAKATLTELSKSLTGLKRQIEWLKVQRVLALLLGVGVGYAIHR